MDMVDFDDLLLLTVQLWRRHPNVLKQHQEHYRYLLIDEYQDTNAAQFELMAMLAAAHLNICAVGDDDQSIYGWRGADVRNILRFEEHFPNATVIRLEQNYRSTNTILKAANAVIANNLTRHHKELWSARGEGRHITVVRADDEAAEARFVIDYLQDRQAERGTSYDDFAVLYRSNHQSRALENALREARIPYRLVGSRSFYERKEILDAVSFLRAAQNPKDDISTLRILNVPPRGVGDKAVARLKELRDITGLPIQELFSDESYMGSLPAATAGAIRDFHQVLRAYGQKLRQAGNLGETVREFFTDTGYIDGLGRMYKPREDALVRRENVFELLNHIAEYEARHAGHAGLRDFLEEFTLLDDSDKVDNEEAANAVTLLTVHAAKGLEFPVVFVVGMENGLFPHQQALEDRSIEEERRLFYVALTRAQDEVTLTYAGERRVRGEKMHRRPSPFLDEVPEESRIVTDPASALQPASAEDVADFLAEMRAMFEPA
jgi:superfamily I DNA/RNA helicase